MQKGSSSTPKPRLFPKQASYRVPCQHTDFCLIKLSTSTFPSRKKKCSKVISTAAAQLQLTKTSLRTITAKHKVKISVSITQITAGVTLLKEARFSASNSALTISTCPSVPKRTIADEILPTASFLLLNYVSSYVSSKTFQLKRTIFCPVKHFSS